VIHFHLKVYYTLSRSDTVHLSQVRQGQVFLCLPVLSTHHSVSTSGPMSTTLFTLISLFTCLSSLRHKAKHLHLSRVSCNSGNIVRFTTLSLCPASLFTSPYVSASPCPPTWPSQPYLSSPGPSCGSVYHRQFFLTIFSPNFIHQFTLKASLILSSIPHQAVRWFTNHL
jgi:hypothetical protein